MNLDGPVLYTRREQSFGRENVYLSAAVYGLTREQIDARLNEILSFAEIGQFIDRPVKTYSRCMFVRLAFAIIAQRCEQEHRALLLNFQQ